MFFHKRKFFFPLPFGTNKKCKLFKIKGELFFMDILVRENKKVSMNYDRRLKKFDLMCLVLLVCKSCCGLGSLTRFLLDSQVCFG